MSRVLVVTIDGAAGTGKPPNVDQSAALGGHAASTPVAVAAPPPPPPAAAAVAEAVAREWDWRCCSHCCASCL